MASISEWVDINVVTHCLSTDLKDHSHYVGFKSSFLSDSRLRQAIFNGRDSSEFLIPENIMNKKKIFIVDDETPILNLFKKSFEKKGYAIGTAKTNLMHLFLLLPAMLVNPN
jgi:PleD family two-component response regulator